MCSYFSGVGYSFVFLTSGTTLPLHFKTKKFLVLSIASAGYGVGTLICPYAFLFVLEGYGYTISGIFLASMAAITCVAGCLYFPVTTIDGSINDAPGRQAEPECSDGSAKCSSVEGQTNCSQMIEESNLCDQQSPSGTTVGSTEQNGTLSDEVRNIAKQNQRCVMESKNCSVGGQINCIPIEAMLEEGNSCDQETPSGTSMSSTALNDSGVELASNTKQRKGHRMEYRKCGESCKESADFKGLDKSTKIDSEHNRTSLNVTPNARPSASGPATEPGDFEQATESPVPNLQPNLNPTQNDSALAHGPITEITDQCDANYVAVNNPNAATERTYLCVKLKFILSTYTDLHILKNLAFLAVALALLGYGISLSTFDYLLILLEEKGFPRSDFVILQTAMSITNTLLGPLIGYLVSKPSVRPYVKYLYAVACILNGCLVAVAGFVNSLAAFFAISLGRGILMSPINGCLSGVMVDLFGVDQMLEYTAGARVFQGIAYFIGPYIAGK